VKCAVCEQGPNDEDALLTRKEEHGKETEVSGKRAAAIGHHGTEASLYACVCVCVCVE
jgi:hypothetical protein